MPTSLVTGGTGFLGSHLCEHLLSQGHRVICVDNLVVSTLSNIEHIRSDDFVFVNHDMTEHLEVDEQVDFVFHLAALASPIDYMRMPLHSLKVGSYGTHNALGLAKFKRARFLLASTSEVYGDPLVHPQPESYWGNVNPIGPRGVYDEAKRYAELTVFCDGSQTRSFCYVDDLIRGLFLLATSDEHLPVNLGNPSEFSILELAEKVLRVTGSSSEIVYEALPEDDPQQRQPDITRARQVLAWQPETELEEGLKRTLGLSSHGREPVVA
jgi:dTDP-glucose 4,6-dehydratase